MDEIEPRGVFALTTTVATCPPQLLESEKSPSSKVMIRSPEAWNVALSISGATVAANQRSAAASFSSSVHERRPTGQGGGVGLEGGDEKAVAGKGAGGDGGARLLRGHDVAGGGGIGGDVAKEREWIMARRVGIDVGPQEPRGGQARRVPPPREPG